MEFGQIISLVSVGISFLSVAAAFYAVRVSRKAVFSGTYFSEMSDAYADYLKCATDFALRRGLPERDALTASFYRQSLFASEKVSKNAESLYQFLIAWAQEGIALGVSVGDRVEQCQELMRDDLAHFLVHGCH